MSAYSAVTSEADRKSAILEILARAAADGVALLATGSPVQGPLTAHQIRRALGASTDITNRLLDELIVGNSIQRTDDGRYTIN